MSTAFLLVTCCKEPSRAQILRQVVENIKQQAPELLYLLTVFDNASTEPGIVDMLRSTFANVYQADRNVGFWSAVHWWLTQHPINQELPPKYVYVVESDMMHYAFHKVWDAASYLERHPDVGSVRLHEYSVANKHLYNKDAPAPGGRVSAWQSHTNKVTNQPVTLDHDEGEVYRTNFLTHLPALNRFEPTKAAFEQLAAMPHFIEPDFQRMYHDRYKVVALIDGGIYHNDLGGDLKNNAAIGSWTSAEALASMGYQPTRSASITPVAQYTVTKLV